MRFFELLNFQHAIGSLLIPLIFMILLAVGITFMPLLKPSNKEASEELHEFNDNIKEGNKPFPMIMALIIVGTIAWAFFYVMFYGLNQIRL